MLLPEDAAYLARHDYEATVVPDGGYICVVVKEFRLPAGYHVATSDLLIRLPPGFPDAQPDMWWFDPPARIAATGAFPQATESTETYLGRSWQRWSRHFPAGQGRPGRRGLESYMTLIQRDLKKWVPQA